MDESVNYQTVTLRVPFLTPDEFPPELWDWTDLVGAPEPVTVITSGPVEVTP